MTARLLCPACGARVRACSKRAREMHGWAYACLACGHLFDHPIALADSRTIKRWCREEDAESVQCGPDSVPFDPDAARRARIRPAMEVDDDGSS